MSNPSSLAPGLTIRLSPYSPHSPTPKQAVFLSLHHVREALYGGAAGGGKSDALLMDALQYVDVAGYSALILRRTFTDLALPGAIMDRAKEWLRPHRDVHWSAQDKQFRFPSGAKLTFGYLETEQDRYRYQSAEFQYIAFDELTQFEESEYTYLMSRLRRTEGLDVPLRMRGASNPGGVGHEWVKARFVPEPDIVTGELLYPRDEEGEVRVFVPARLRDNPHLSAAEYERNLRELDPVTRAQLLDGDWGARPPGEMFDCRFVELVNVDDVPKSGIRWVRAWDLAGTKKRAKGHDPDYTAGVLMGRSTDDLIYVADVVRVQGEPGNVEALVTNTAERDRRWPGHRVIRMEQEPGSSGKFTTDRFSRKLIGYDFAGGAGDPDDLNKTVSGSKTERARPWAAYWRSAKVRLVRGAWNGAYLAEHEAFPQESSHDDQVDASSLGFKELSATYVAASGSVVPDPKRNPYNASRRSLVGR